VGVAGAAGSSGSQSGRPLCIGYFQVHLSVTLFLTLGSAHGYWCYWLGGASSVMLIPQQVFGISLPLILRHREFIGFITCHDELHSASHLTRLLPF